MIAIPPPPPAVETCIVSWHDGAGGTASGEPFDPASLTTAHKTLPFDTLIKVTRFNDPQHRSVVVRVNNRFSDPARCLNLSKAAFEQIAPLGMGVVKVIAEPVTATEPPAANDEPSSAEEGYRVLSAGPL